MNEYHFVFVKKNKKSYIDGRSNYFYNPLIDELSLRIYQCQESWMHQGAYIMHLHTRTYKKKLLSRGQNISKY